MGKKAPKVLEPGRLSSRNLWGYSLGGVGRDMTYQLVNTCLTIFILFAKGLTPAQYAAIGVIIIVCRIFDGCNDPLMGMLIEKTRTKIGKFKPWILIGCFTNIAVILSLFLVPLQGNAYVIFFAFGYLLWGITYTMNDIAYWGMMPSLTSHPEDRNNISTIANACAGVGAGIVVLLVPAITQDTRFMLGSNAETSFQIVAGIVCALFAICQIMTCLVVKEPALLEAPAEEKKEKRGLGAMFKVLFKNDQLLVTAGSMLMYNIGSAILAALSTFWIYFRICGYNGLLASVFSGVTGVSMAIIVFYPALSKKFTRKQIAKISVSAVVIGYALMFIVALVTGLIPAARTNLIALFAIGICGAIASFGQALYYQVLTISVSNTVEYNELKTGKRDEGMIFSVRPFMAKLGSSFVEAIKTITLIALGVLTYTNTIAEYDKELKLKIIDETQFNNKIADLLSGVPEYVHHVLIGVMTILPMLLVLGSFILYLKKYTIDEKQYDDICAQIKERKENGKSVCDCECHCNCAEGECDENCDCDCTFEDGQCEKHENGECCCCHDTEECDCDCHDHEEKCTCGCCPEHTAPEEATETAADAE